MKNKDFFKSEKSDSSSSKQKKKRKKKPIIAGGTIGRRKRNKNPPHYGNPANLKRGQGGEKTKRSKLTPERRSEIAKKVWAKLTPEQRSERAKKGWETRRKNEEKRRERSERAKKGWEKLTPEERSERAKKGWETRRKNEEERQRVEKEKTQPKEPDTGAISTGYEKPTELPEEDVIDFGGTVLENLTYLIDSELDRPNVSRVLKEYILSRVDSDGLEDYASYLEDNASLLGNAFNIYFDSFSEKVLYGDCVELGQLLAGSYDSDLVARIQKAYISDTATIVPYFSQKYDSYSTYGI